MTEAGSPPPVHDEQGDEGADSRLTAPAAERNKEPILKVLERVLPDTGLVLEVASGTGQHVVHFARALTRLTWQPSEVDATSRRSINAWLAGADLANVRRPLDLDVRTLPWPVPPLDAVVCINLIHIAPWSVAEALFAGAGLALGKGGLLYLYGPYFRRDRQTAPGNVAFDSTLRGQNPEWGVRNLEEVGALAKDRGFDPATIFEMPANNLSVLFRKC